MDTVKNQSNAPSEAVFIAFEAVAERVATSVGARLGMTAYSGGKADDLINLPLLRDSLGRKMLLPAWTEATCRMASRVSAWGNAAADDSAFSFEMYSPEKQPLVESLIVQALVLSMVAAVSEACGHRLAAADRERSDEAEDRLVMALC